MNAQLFFIAANDWLYTKRISLIIFVAVLSLVATPGIVTAGTDVNNIRPELNLVYWETGNPALDWNGAVRRGDNLYTDCIVALDADTGKLKWTSTRSLQSRVALWMDP